MINVKLHIIGPDGKVLRKGVPTSIDKLSGVIVAPKNTLLGNPEELMFKRTGEADYTEITQVQKEFIRAWCSANCIEGSALTLSQVDKIIALSDYQQRTLEVIGERTESKNGVDGEASKSVSGDGDIPT